MKTLGRGLNSLSAFWFSNVLTIHKYRCKFFLLLMQLFTSFIFVCVKYCFLYFNLALVLQHKINHLNYFTCLYVIDIITQLIHLSCHYVPSRLSLARRFVAFYISALEIILLTYLLKIIANPHTVTTQQTLSPNTAHNEQYT